MKTKLFTLLLAVAASVGTMYAEKVQIGDLYYNLDATNHTAEVTYQLEWNSNNYSGLTTAIIPASVEYNSVAYSVTSIGNYAFRNCTGLTSVTIPNSVTSIGNQAFYYCTGLTSPVYNTHVFAYMPTSYSGAYTIPDGIESIAGSAFYKCTGLTSVTIPNSVTSIGYEAFWDCSGLTSIEIPNSVTSIGDYAFQSCSGLTSVTIPSSVTSIGDGAFRSCTGLTSVTIPNSVISIGDVAFYGCSGLTSVAIPNSVTSIGDGAFRSCTGLTSVTIPNSVTSIGEYAFASCTGLTSIEIPNSVTRIGERAFSLCTGLTSVIWSAKNCADFASDNTPFYDLQEQITSFTFGSEVEHIPANLCNGMSNLTSIEIPNSVTSIGSGAFSGCSGLTSVEAPAGFFDVPEGSWPYCTKILNHVTVNGGELTENALLFINRSYKTLQTLDVSSVTNTEFADEAFKGFYNLRTLPLPANLERIGYMAVAECVKLQSIDIPASVEEIDDRAFEDCRSIQTITFGGAPAGAPRRFNAPAASASQLRRIGNWAFYNAHKLQNLVIPEGVTEIGDGAFYGCTYLEDLILPSSVQTIGDNTFALCAKLKKITVNSVTPPSIQAKTFFDVKRQIPVYVPDEAVSAYEDDTYWQEFDIQGVSQMPTGIDNVSSSLQGGDRGRLILHNGQIFILRGEKVYNAQGALVK